MSTSWDDITSAVDTAPYPIEILTPQPGAPEKVLQQLQISDYSWLGAVCKHSGGLLIDHHWLRVFGSGCPSLPDTPARTGKDRLFIVAVDVLGGQFAWIPAEANAKPTIHYFAPETLRWSDLKLGYQHWLNAMLSGTATAFYQHLRWPGWEEEVTALAPGLGIQPYPPAWTIEGADLSKAERNAVPMNEVLELHVQSAAQIEQNPGATKFRFIPM